MKSGVENGIDDQIPIELSRIENYIGKWSQLRTFLHTRKWSLKTLSKPMLRPENSKFYTNWRSNFYLHL